MPAWPSYPGRPGPMKIPPLRGSSCGPGRIRTYDQGIHLAPAFPPGVDYLFTRARPVRVGAGCSSLLSRALEPSGSLCTFRRCTGGSAQGCHGITHPEGFPEFIPSTSRVSARRHLVDESPALTAVLQAQPRRIVAAARGAAAAASAALDCGPGTCRGGFPGQPPSAIAAETTTAVTKSDLIAGPSCHRCPQR